MLQLFDDNDDIVTKYGKQCRNSIIAVDYDDTITEYRPYPEKAPLNPKAKKYLDKLHEAGFEIILWSARLEKDYDEAYDRCVNEFGLSYLHKDNPYFVHGSTGKLIASFYIDDHSYINKKVPWRKIYKYLLKQQSKKTK